MVYADAAAYWGPVSSLSFVPRGLERINWEKPPPWADVWDKNSHVIDGDEDVKKAKDINPQLLRP